MKISSIVLATALLALAIPAGAETGFPGYPKADTLEKFEQVSAAVVGDMQGDGRYRFVTPSDRRTVEAALAAMHALFERSGSVDKMTDDAKLALFNSQERINGILTQSDAERLVCSNTPVIGSNIPTRTCRTYADVRERNESSKKYFLDRGTTPCRPSNPYCRLEHGRVPRGGD